MLVTSSILTGGGFGGAFGAPVIVAPPAQIAPAASRTPAEALDIIGTWHNAHAKRSIISIVDRMLRGEDRAALARNARGGDAGRTCPTKIVSIYEADPAVWDEITRMAIQAPELMRPSAAGGFLYLTFDRAREAVDEFWRQVVTGVLIPKSTCSSLKLRETLIADRGEMNRVDQMRTALIAYRAHLGLPIIGRDFETVPTTSILTIE